jgi:hypothetical protein
MDESWEVVWKELREALTKQPRCTEHPKYPSVRTLGQQVINDIIDVDASEVVVRSHKTMKEDHIEAERFRIWWEHLQHHGTASLVPDDKNNPHPWRSRVVGAFWVRCLPMRVHHKSSREIQLVGHAQAGAGDRTPPRAERP